MRQFSYPNSQFTTILGGASIGWKLNVYDTGTTDYASIYSNLAQTTPTANPVIADADGFLASFYWTGTVDVVLTDENDNLVDSATGIQDLVSTINAVVVAGSITLPFGTASGDGNTITTTLPITADFSDGGVFIIRANASNAGTINTPNLQVNSYASRRIKKIGGVALIANDIVSGMNMVLVYHEAQDCYYLINHEATFLKRDGTAKMLGAIDMDSHKITNLTAGTANGDAVNYLQLGGDSSREFAVAAGTTGNSAVNLTQLNTKAPTAGNAAQEFAVATATTGNSAVNKTQFDAGAIQAGGVIKSVYSEATGVSLSATAADIVTATISCSAGVATKFRVTAKIPFDCYDGSGNPTAGFKLINVTSGIDIDAIHLVSTLIASVPFADAVVLQREITITPPGTTAQFKVQGTATASGTAGPTFSGVASYCTLLIEVIKT